MDWPTAFSNAATVIAMAAVMCAMFWSFTKL